VSASLAPAEVELVIFDCDGVLIDSERIAVRVDVEVLAELGWSLTETEVIERFMGRSDAETRAEVEHHLGHPLSEGWQKRVDARYRRAFAAELAPIAGVIEALDTLPVPDCVASSATHAHLRFTLGLVGLLDHFRGRIFSAQDVAAGKPAPDVFLYAAEQMGVAPERCIVVEDSLNGVRAARAAGMRVFAYGGGLTPKERLTGPDTLVFEDMRDLPDLIERWCTA
jgi:HAD superfamily hydrolase (TIGR01509 family)